MSFGYVDNLKELFSIIELALSSEEELKQYLNGEKSFPIVNHIIDMTSNKIVIIPFEDGRKEDVMNVYYGYDYNLKKYWFYYEF